MVGYGCVDGGTPLHYAAWKGRWEPYARLKAPHPLLHARPNPATPHQTAPRLPPHPAP